MSVVRVRTPVALAAVLALLLSLLPLADARAGDGAGGSSAPESASRTYTTDADFGEGSKINLVAEGDRLRLDDTVRAFDFIWVAVSSAGTVVKIDTKTGEVLGEYRTAPQGQPTNPSRTTVDQDGNVWAGNRNGSSVVKIGLLENGQCEDRDGNGVIDTSTGLGDVRPWTNAGGADTAGGVSTAADECITHYVRVNSSGTRHVSVDGDNNVWVSGTSGRRFDLVDGQTGEILRAEPSVNFGGYGGLIDPDGVIWSARRLLRWDTANPLTGPSGGNWRGYTHDSYGLCIDQDGNVWNTQLSGNRVRKFAPDGTELGSFPHGFNNAQGCVVDGNGDVWVAHSILGGGNSVGRLRNDGTFVGRVPVGSGPTGVAVDGDGKVWATNHNSRTVSRIDPDAGPIGDDGAGPVGAVDLVTENLGGSLYNYSDMTGSTLTGAPRTGTWTVVYDSEVDGAEWGSIDWLAELSGDARLSVTAASSTDGTSFTTPVEVTNGGDLEIADGRHLRIVVSFTRSADGDSPLLDELTVRTAGALVRPLAVAGGPYTVPEGGAVFLTGSADPGLDQRPVEFAWDLDGDGTFETPGSNPRFDASALDGPSVVEVTLEACYAGGGCDTDTAIVEVLNVPPEVDAGPDLHARPGEEVVLDGRFADPAGEADAPFSAAWTVEGDTSESEVGHAEPVLRDVRFDEPGSYAAGLAVTDADGDTGSDELRVEVAAVDPECGGAGPTLDELWPPDHRVLVAVGVTGVTHPAGDDVEVTITGIRQDEPVDSIGDGSFAPDGFGVGTGTAQLRAERQGGGNGRFYHVFFEATTEAGGSCGGVVRVVVPHDRNPRHEPVDDGPLYDSTVEVGPEPGTPAALDGRYEVTAGGVLEVGAPGVLANDLHPDGAALTAVLEEPPVAGALDLRDDGSFTYEAPDEPGEVTFAYRASDGTLESPPAVVTIAVSARAFPLYVPDREVWTGEDTRVEFTLLSRGEGAGDATFALLDAPAHGTAVLDGGVVTYVPGPDFHGEDALTYEASSGGATSNLGVVRLVVTPSNDTPVALPVAVTVAEDSSVLVDVLESASDPDGDVLQIVHLTDPGTGTAVVEDGQVRYTPEPDYFGPDRFRYRVADPHGAIAAAWVNVTVTEVNDPPVTSPVHYTIDWDDGFLQVPAQEFASNDVPGPPNETDQALTVTAVEATADTRGTVVLEAGLVTYTPEPDFAGEARFAYEVCDDGTTAGEPDPQCALGDVLVTVEAVNRPPVAFDQEVTTAEDTPVEITLEGSDPDGDSLTFAVVDPPGHGTLAGAPPVLTYTPGPDYFGPDLFTFVANDGESDSPPGTVGITVTEVNDPPVTSDVHYALEAGEVLVVPAQEFAANDVPGPPNESDQTLTVTGVQATADTNGTLEFEDGTVTYTPEPEFAGEARFVYEVCDDGTTAGEPDPLCATGTVFVDVVGPARPVANDVQATLPEDTHVALDVRANDSHPDGLAFSVVEVSDPANGVVAIITMGDDTGSVFYKPDGDYFGPDQFTYTVEDTRGGRATATVFVTVTEVNDPPVTADAHYTITWLEVLEVPAPDLAANDVPGPPNEADQALTVTAVEATAETHGTLEFEDGVVTYTPEPDFAGQASFAYEVCDDGTTAGEPDPLCATGTVFVTVEEVNRPPVAFDQQVATTEGVTVEITLEAIDPDGDALTYLLASVPDHGGLFGAPPVLTYEPTTGFTGTDSFEFFASDGELDSNLATVTITVHAATVEALAVTPASSFLEPGQEQQLTATATFDSGDSADVTGQAAWSSSDDAVATVDAGGLVTAVADGEAEITASHAGLEASATVLVESFELVEIVVEPAASTLLIGDTVALTATGVRADGTSEPLTATAVWASGDEDVVAVAAGATVVATATGEGTAAVSASLGGLSGSATVDVVAPVDDDVPPAAVIASPDDGDELAGPTPVTGTADDANLLKWELDYAPAGESAFTLLAEGTEPVLDDALGTFDPTTLLNDLYTLRLRAYDLGGNITTDQVVVQVAGDQKVGMFSLAFEDLSVPLRGMPVRITRVYDSRDRASQGDFGFGWGLEIQTTRVRLDGVHGRDWRMVSSGGFIPTYTIQPTRPHVATITLPDGHVEQFDMRPVPSSQQLIPPQFVSASYVARPGTRGTLTPLGNTGLVALGPDNDLELLDDSTFEPYDPTLFRYTALNGDQFTIHVRDGVRSIRDTNGNTISIGAGGITHSAGVGVQFDRDAEGRIIAITDPAGNTQTYDYDVNGDLAAHTDPLGNRTTYRYNRNHGLLEIRDALGRQPLRVEYDEDGRVAATIDPDGNRVEFDRDLDGRQEVVRDRRGNATVYLYDERGNVTAETDPDGNTVTRSYDARGNELTTTDPLGNTTTRTYDSRDLLLSQTDAAGNTTTWTYNSRGQVMSETDGDGNVTSYTYDASGNETGRTDPRGQTTTSTFDAAGNRLSTTDASGNTLQYTYDSRGNRVAEVALDGAQTTYTYDANGNETSATTTRTGADGQPVAVTTARVYDAAGRLVEEVDPEGGLTRRTYDALGKEIEVTDPAGRTTRHFYDALGNMVRTEHPDGTEERWEYDAERNRTRWVDRAGRAVTYTYDRQNRLVTTTHPDGAVEHVEHDDSGREVARVDANGNRTEFVLDAVGRRAKVIGALGGETSTTYDAGGRPTSVVDQAGNVMTHSYDAAGNIVRTDFPDGTFMTSAYDELGRVVAETDLAGRSTLYTYDPLGRLLTVTDPLGGQTAFAYDEMGNKVSHTDANGNTTAFAYDGLGRMAARTLPLGQTETFDYDATGNVTSRTDFGGATTTYAYDSADRLVETTFPGGGTVSRTYTATGMPATVVDGRGTTTFSYDDRDRLTLRQDPDGRTIAYTYDAAGNVTSTTTAAGTTASTYDGLHRLLTVTDQDGGTTSYSYDAVGNRTAAAHPGGVSTAYAYDTMGRLTGAETTAAGGQTLFSQDYTLSAAGERLHVVEHDGREVSYAYDALSRLAAETVTDPVAGTVERTYAYDAVGNRVGQAVDGAAVTATYDANDRLLSQGGVAYTHDANGNTVSIDDGGAVTSLAYDARDLLVSVSGPAGTAAFAYDGDGNRVRLDSGGDTTHLLVDTNRRFSAVLAEFDGAGTPLAGYTHGDGLLGQHRVGATSYYHADGLGSTRLLTDASGAVTDRYHYEAFGTLEGSTGSTVNPYLFAGERYEEAVGLYHLRARDYDPATGRFRTMDPFLGVERDPVTLHRYLYAHADPVNNVDPGGEMTMTMPMTMPMTISLPTFTLSSVAVKGMVLAAVKAVVMVCAGGAALGVLAAVPGVGRGNPCGISNFNILFPGPLTPKTTEHISEAIASYRRWGVLDRGARGGSRGWYRSDPRCKGNVAAVTGLWCDEYPFYTTQQGGPLAVPKPSLKLVPAWEQRIQAGQLTAFYGACRVKAHDPIEGSFGVVPVSVPMLPWACKAR